MFYPKARFRTVKAAFLLRLPSPKAIDWTASALRGD